MNHWVEDFEVGDFEAALESIPPRPQILFFSDRVFTVGTDFAGANTDTVWAGGVPVQLTRVFYCSINLDDDARVMTAGEFGKKVLARAVAAVDYSIAEFIAAEDAQAFAFRAPKLGAKHFSTYVGGGIPLRWTITQDNHGRDISLVDVFAGAAQKEVAHA